MPEYSVLGKRLPRVDAKDKVTGQGKYANDLVMPNMLWGKIKRSPFPHARILNIDTSKAERLPGVKGVITGKDPEFAFKWGFGLPGCPDDETAIAVDKVRFIGEPVAAIAAMDEDLAEGALSLIEVEYEELPPVFDYEHAMDESMPLVHEDKKNNISYRFTMDYGDVEKAFKESDYVREDRFRTFRVRHAMIEPHAALAYWDPYSGSLTLQASKQSPYFTYRLLGAFFRLPLNKVRLIQPYVGGGFGGKNAPYPLDFYAPLLSKKTGKPVKIVYSQEEVFTTCWRKHTMRVDIKTGVKKDGTLMGIEAHTLADGGAFSAIGPITMWLTGTFLTMPYKLPNLKYEAIRVYTNYPAAVALQGHGVDHTRYVADVQLDMIAEDLGLDPVEIRLKNAIPAKNYETINGIKVLTSGIKECTEKVAEAIHWKERKKESKKEGVIRRGVGFGCGLFITGARLASRDADSASIRVHEDGSVSLMTGVQDVGQGSDTLFAQIVAEELGLGLEDIRVARIDSAVSPIGFCTASSRCTFVTGHATRNAALDVKKQLQEYGSRLWEANPEDIEFKNKKVFVKGTPDKGMPFGRFVRSFNYGEQAKELLGRGSAALNLPKIDIEHGYGQPCHNFSFATCAAEVEVDIETGQVKVVNIVAADDCGRPLNPLALEGQAEGEVGRAIGFALFEENIRENGRSLNPTLLDYKLPRAPDVPTPRIIEVITDDPMGPYGAKEGSEALQVAATPAIINAIHDATGVWIKELPATAEKILKALKEKAQK